MSTLNIDIDSIAANKDNFKTEKGNFKNNSYNTFKTGYISTCSDSTVQSMRSNLNTLYKAIENAYSEIYQYWDDYVKDFKSLENSLKSFNAACSNSRVNSYLSGFSDVLPQTPKKATSFVKIKNVNYKTDSGTSSKSDNSKTSILKDIATTITTGAFLGIGANIGTAKSGLSKIKSGITNAYTKISDGVSSFVGSVKSGLSKVKDVASTVGSVVKTAVKTTVKQVKTSVSTVVASVKHLVHGAISWGENVWCFLLNGGAGMAYPIPFGKEIQKSINNNLLQLGDIIMSDSKTLKDFDFYIDLPFFSTANENNSYTDDMIKDIKGEDDLIDSFDKTKVGNVIEENSLVKNDSFIANVEEGIGEALPTIGLAVVTGGGSTAMGVTGFVTGSGEGYSEALLDGATSAEANKAGTIKGAFNFVSWYAGGKLNETGVAKSIATKLGLSATIAEKPIT